MVVAVASAVALRPQTALSAARPPQRKITARGMPAVRAISDTSLVIGGERHKGHVSPAASKWTCAYKAHVTCSLFVPSGPAGYPGDLPLRQRPC